jgi:hypothetical protein
MAAAPAVGQWPTVLLAVVLGAVPRLDHAFLLDDFAFPAYVRAWPGAWRAEGAPLKTFVEKVVTAQGRGRRVVVAALADPTRAATLGIRPWHVL